MIHADRPLAAPVHTTASPPPELRAWVEASLGDRAAILHTGLLAQGREGGPWRVVVAVGDEQRDLVLKAARPEPDELARFVTAAAALELAEAHAVPAPRPLAHDLEAATGWLTTLVTRLPGSSRIGRRIGVARLRALGAAAAGIHRVTGSPTDELPERARTLDGYDLDAGATGTTSTPLLERARAVLAEHAPPDDPPGFVHGDLWQGNTLWDDDDYVGAIDWDFAGFGPAGIDLGSLRADVALLHGADAAAEVLAGWCEAAGEAPPSLAWWDLVAGVATPDDLNGWLPNFHAQGRADLDLPTVTGRRDAFVLDALERLA
ncbi:aminoglycoside phosphotransferase family protein [Egicoccus sp. AB-alg6-2]|uniref:aminoglycoside phosphotransferase family protein n=1 Tax=Egicoccus sp. AB-alg6-2 TaxID=3242692 RepID=UPI00359CE025